MNGNAVQATTAEPLELSKGTLQNLATRRLCRMVELGELWLCRVGHANPCVSCETCTVLSKLFLELAFHLMVIEQFDTLRPKLPHAVLHWPNVRKSLTRRVPFLVPITVTFMYHFLSTFSYDDN